MNDVPIKKPVSIRNILTKAGVLFVLANLLFAAAYPLNSLGRISAYNRLVPGRLRLPYADHPERAYSLSLYNLEAMFASHAIAVPRPVAAPRTAGELTVILIGDSSTWGFLLPPPDTLSEQLNALGLATADGRRLRFYNLGYPVMSLTKDLVILEHAMRYQPDLIVWPLTLESLPYDKQLFPPLLQNNPEPVQELITTHRLRLNANDPAFYQPGFLQRTLIGARRPLADLFRLQLYGVAWAATGIDQDLPSSYTPRLENLEADLSFHDLEPPHLTAEDLALDVLVAGISTAGATPVLLVNEPMFISQGQNSHLRYNFFYPRWAYDDYRRILPAFAAERGWAYVDAWDLIPGNEFTNSAVHLSAAGTFQFAQWLVPHILSIINR